MEKTGVVRSGPAGDFRAGVGTGPPGLSGGTLARPGVEGEGVGASRKRGRGGDLRAAGAGAEECDRT